MADQRLKQVAPWVTVCVAAMAAGMAGCGGVTGTTVSSPTPPSNPPAGSGVGFGGRVLAGSVPMVGASVQLYAAGSAGGGQGSAAVLTTALTTDSQGAFTVPSGYSCTASTPQLYLVARGGSPGAGAVVNSAVVFLAVVGGCEQVAASSQFVVNEVTTVAAAYALNPFMGASASIGASATNSYGLQNAFATAAALANGVTGNSPGPTFAANGSSPAATIGSLANLLDGCALSGGSTCTTLFDATTGGPPNNTLDAALNIVRHPAFNVANLYAYSFGSTPFSPALGTTPSDWTLAVNYTGGGMNAPTGLGIDGSGNVWVANYFNVASVFSPLGKPLVAQGITGSGLSASYGLAVDANNHAWIPNEPGVAGGGNSVSVLDETGMSFAGSSGYGAGGLDYPVAVAIDTDGSAWVADLGNSHLTHLSSAGMTLSGASGYTSSQLMTPDAVAIDAAHNVWVANHNGSTVTKVAPDGSSFMSYACCNSPSAVALDQGGNVWVANYGGDSISEVSAAGVVVSSGGYTGSGLDHPQGLAIDGAGNVWVANYRGVSVTELMGATGATPGAAISPNGGLGVGAGLSGAYAVAVDASGNLWVTNFNSSVLTEFIGIAAPVKTPLIGLPSAP
jgi:hypothetical protein